MLLDLTFERFDLRHQRLAKIINAVAARALVVFSSLVPIFSLLTVSELSVGPSDLTSVKSIGGPKGAGSGPGVGGAAVELGVGRCCYLSVFVGELSPLGCPGSVELSPRILLVWAAY
jgi:hypothetical protein